MSISKALFVVCAAAAFCGFAAQASTLATCSLGGVTVTDPTSCTLRSGNNYAEASFYSGNGVVLEGPSATLLLVGYADNSFVGDAYSYFYADVVTTFSTSGPLRGGTIIVTNSSGNQAGAGGPAVIISDGVYTYSFDYDCLNGICGPVGFNTSTLPFELGTTFTVEEFAKGSGPVGNYAHISFTVENADGTDAELFSPGVVNTPEPSAVGLWMAGGLVGLLTRRGLKNSI